MAVETSYPFAGQVTARIGVNRPAHFTVRMRVPAWCEDATFAVNGDPSTPRMENGFAAWRREWRDGDVITMVLPMPLRREGCVVHRGPLVLALALPEQWRPRRSRHAIPDWEVRTSAPWAFAIEDLSPAQVLHRAIPTAPFDHHEPAVEVTISARPVENWTEHRGSAGPVPEVLVLGETLPVRLVPYGCTALRVTCLPGCSGAGVCMLGECSR